MKTNVLCQYFIGFLVAVFIFVVFQVSLYILCAFRAQLVAAKLSACVGWSLFS